MNILTLGAHYVDIELGCSGTLINHVKMMTALWFKRPINLQSYKCDMYNV